MTSDQIVARLRSLGNPDALAGMARYGITTDRALGVSMPRLRHLALEIGRNHALAGELWRTGSPWRLRGGWLSQTALPPAGSAGMH